LDQELRRWLTTYARELNRPLREDDHLFPGRKGSRYAWRTTAEGTKARERQPAVWEPDRPVVHTARIIKGAMARVGLPTKFEGTHTIRRAVARAFFDSMSAEVGYDSALRTVSALLHHQSSATTEHYLGLSSERKRRDERLRGRPFLTAMVATDNVIAIRPNHAV
jgi:integrase